MQKEIEIIANARISFRGKFKELFEYQSLILELCKRDLKTRYAQTVLGLAWSILNPLISVLLLFFVFGVVVRTDTHGIPSILFVMSGLVIWNYFSRVVGDASQSLVGAQTIVKKIYFPRIIIPISKVIVGLVDLLIVLVLLLILLLIYQFPVSWSWLWVIPICLATILTSLTFAIWVSALSIRFRDFNQIIPVLLRIGMFISPIGYGLSSVPPAFHTWYQLNPVTGLIEGFRSVVLGTPFQPAGLYYTILISLLLLALGLYYFFRMDKYIGDIL